MAGVDAELHGSGLFRGVGKMVRNLKKVLFFALSASFYNFLRWSEVGRPFRWRQQNGFQFVGVAAMIELVRIS